MPWSAVFHGAFDGIECLASLTFKANKNVCVPSRMHPYLTVCIKMARLCTALCTLVNVLLF